MTNVGFIGAGNIASNHARVLDSLGANLLALADIDPETRRSFAAEYGVPETYDDYEAMLAAEPLDLVVVAVPNALHAPCAIAALEAGCNVMLEKPVATTLEDAQRIAEAEAANDGIVAIGFVMAFSPWFEDVCVRMAAGELGTVYDVEMELVKRRGIPQIGSWFTTKEVSGGGVLIDLGVHVLHLALRVLDFPAIETVRGQTGSHFGTDPDYTYLSMWAGDPIEGGTFDVDDHARAFIETADGTTISLHVAWASNSETRQQIRFYGDEAGVTVDTSGGETTTTMYAADRDALTETELVVGGEHRLTAEWRYILSVVRGEREHTRNTLAEGIAVQRIVDAIYESAEAGREISLRED